MRIPRLAFRLLSPALLAPILLAPALLAPAQPASAATTDIPGSGFTSGNWSGSGETGDDGAFLDCYTYTTYSDGAELWVALYADDSLTIFLSAPGTSFIAGQDYSAWIMTEVGLPFSGDAYAVSETYVSMTIDGMTDAIDFLTQGSYFRALGVDIDGAFDVRGLGGALAEAKSCLTTHATLVTASAPATGGDRPSLGSSGGNGTRPVQMSKPVGPGAPERAAARKPFLN